MPDHCTQPATANSGASSTLTVPLQTDRFDSDWVHWERVEGYKQFTKVNPPAKDGDDGRRTLGEVALGALRSAARDSHLEFSKDFEKASTGDQEKLAIEFWATQDVRNCRSTYVQHRSLSLSRLTRFYLAAYRHSIMSRNASTAAGRFTLAVDIASDEGKFGSSGECTWLITQTLRRFWRRLAEKIQSRRKIGRTPGASGNRARRVFARLSPRSSESTPVSISISIPRRQRTNFTHALHSRGSLRPRRVKRQNDPSWSCERQTVQPSCICRYCISIYSICCT